MTDEVSAARFGDGEAHRPGDSSVAAGDPARDRVDLIRDGLDAGQHLLAGGREREARRAAREELGPERRLERGDAAPHRRVLHPELTRGAGEAAGARDREEVAQIVPVQGLCTFARGLCALQDSRGAAARSRVLGMNDAILSDHIVKTGLGFWASKTLLSAVELGVFTELARGGKRLPELEQALGLHPRSSRDFLDALVALRFLDRTDGVYANTPETDHFLDRAKPTYLGGFLEMANSRLYRFWGGLTEGLRTGEPQNEAKEGGDLFDGLYDEPARLEEFLGAMTGLSRKANQAIAARLPWSDYGTFADVGTAQGDLAVQIALRNPHLRGLGFDLPAVRPVFERYAARNGLAERLTFQEGDFLRQPLPKADVILMGHILHDWDLATKKMLVSKAYDALPPGGAFVVYEAVIDDDRSQNAFGLLMSLNMLIETRGGFDFTGADCVRWMKEAGFREARVEHVGGPESFVVGVK